MNLTLTKSSIDPIEHLLNALTEFIDSLKQSKKTLADNIRFCRQLRTSRKKFEKELRKTIACFNTLPENQQVEIELAFHKLLKKLQNIVPEVNQEIENDKLFFLFSYFLKRDVNKSLQFFKKAQAKMSAQLYTDPTEKIINDPALQQKLVDQWGDLANEQY